ncbi:hypothetical protein THRCLA_21959 [Thraustotheca clavata]|uniref:BED-type domain-containing protein n=1 Tax=Thraustotheca clavata TaxID=74557 RepID=A0A1V9ZH07_9STRA|nr:hypothetical protein THRCLA_21959 [Thraustotheca clavata]
MGNPIKFTTVGIESAKHGHLRIFKLKNISRPEIWANASLVAPNNAMECCSRDVTHFYCHLCDDIFGHDPTRLQNLHRHMKSKHLPNIQQIQQDMVPSEIGNKRKEQSFVQTLVDDNTHEVKRIRQASPVLTTSFRSTKLGPLSLFKVKHINRPEIWMYVSLVAPNNVEMNPTTGWTSKDATLFYCHLCDDCFPHDYARSQNLHRHVKNKHKAELEAYMKKIIKSNEGNKDKKQEAIADLTIPSSAPMNPKNARQCEMLLAEWLATCRRPIDLVEDAPFKKFLSFVQNTPGQFTVPTRTLLETHMDDLYSIKRKEIFQMLEEECRYFSLSSKVRTISELNYIVWTLHFITPNFEWRHILLGYQHLPSNKPSPEWLSQSLNRLLSEWGLSMANLTMVVSDLDMRHLQVPAMLCMGHTLNVVIARLLCEKQESIPRGTESMLVFTHFDTLDHVNDDYIYDMLSQPDHSSFHSTTPLVSEANGNSPLQIPHLVRRVFLLTQYFNTTPKAKRTLDHFISNNQSYDTRPAVNCPLKWRKLYRMLYEMHSMKAGVDLFFNVVESQPNSFPFPCTATNLTPGEWCLLEGLLTLVEPCLEVMHVVFGQASTNSLALMLSILQMFARDLASPRFFNLRGFPSDHYKHEAYLDTVLYQLNTARHMVQTLLFGYLDDHPAMWTCPLHPSIAATLAHCTEDEKSQVKHRLQTECMHVSVDKPKKKRNLKYMQQVMGARDEMLDTMAMDISIEEELHIYFSTVVPGIEDTLSWWKNQHSNFPRLSGLARKWLGATATAFHKSQEETDQPIHTSPDLASRMAFLAENYTPPTSQSITFV